jgi:predicted phage-related endonuclease
MTMRSLKSFERRWALLRKLAAAQLKDFERDRKEIARAIKRHRIKNDVAAVREALAHSKRVQQAIKTTRKFVATKDKVMKQAKRRGRLLARAFR